MTSPQLRSLLVVAAILLLPSPSTAEVRRWKSNEGKFEVRAELLGATDSAVTLKKSDGKVVSVQLNSLSKPDRDYVRAWQLARTQGATARPMPGIVPDVMGEPVDLLDLIDPVRDTQRGKWEREGTSLVSSPASRNRLLVPYTVEGSYQLRLTAERKTEKGSLNVGIVVGDHHHALVVFEYGRQKNSGVAWIDEKNEPANSTFYRKPVLEPGRASEIICTVHGSHYRISCDGKTMVEWSGDPSRLSLHPNFKVPKNRLFIETLYASYRISELEYLPIRQSELSNFRPRGQASPADSVALIEHPLGHGTGFLAAPNLLVTNHHVIEEAPTGDLKVFFPQQSDPLAVDGVLFENAERDLAILSVKTVRTPLAVAYDGHFPKGESVQLHGNPSIGGGVTLRNAVVKGTARATVRVGGMDFLQVDASINPGSSGGPVLNELEQVVGVIAMKATDEGEQLIREGLARLDDSLVRKPGQKDQEGVVFGIPAQALAKALDAVRSLSAEAAGRNNQMHENRVVFTRLVTLAGIRLLEANVNVPDEMRLQASQLKSVRQAEDSVELIPAAQARLLRSALESESTTNMISLLQQDIIEHLKTISASPYLSTSTKRNFNALSQRVKSIEKFAQRPGSDYQRFSATMMRFQMDVTRLLTVIKKDL